MIVVLCMVKKKIHILTKSSVIIVVLCMVYILLNILSPFEAPYVIRTSLNLHIFSICLVREKTAAGLHYLHYSSSLKLYEDFRLYYKITDWNNE